MGKKISNFIKIIINFIHLKIKNSYDKLYWIILQLYVLFVIALCKLQYKLKNQQRDPVTDAFLLFFSFFVLFLLILVILMYFGFF